MPEEFDIRGAEALVHLGKVLKSAGNGKELRKELLRNIRATSKSITTEVRSNLREVLPHRGGMADEFSRGVRIGVRSRLTGDNSGVRLVVKYGKHDMPNLDRGRLRHPVYGNRNKWESQTIASNSISLPIERGRSKMQLAVAEAMESVFNKIERSV